MQTGHNIEHVIVLMLENRSFDNILGSLYLEKTTDEFDGLNGDYASPYNLRTPSDPHSEKIHVWNSPVEGGRDMMTIPYPDPFEPFKDMQEQIFGADPVGTSPAPMSGFVANYAKKLPVGNAPYAQPKDIMHYFTGNEVPVSHFLASNFAVSDCWFGSLPSQTYPNRIFAFSGSSDGKLDDLDYGLGVFYAGTAKLDSIFQRIDRDPTMNAYTQPYRWKVYYHDYSLSRLVAYVNQAYKAGKAHPSTAQVANFDLSDFGDKSKGTTFFQDLEEGLPTFSFLEPRYSSDLARYSHKPNSNHPGNSRAISIGEINDGPHISVADGEALLAQVYNALRRSKYWDKSLLVITYDENGGCFDHRGPYDQAEPPGGKLNKHFDFTRLGPRVPTILVSPSIKAGTIMRPKGYLPGSTAVTPYDHTSLISSLRAWRPGMGDPLTPRDRAAPTWWPIVDASYTNPAGLYKGLFDPDSYQTPSLPAGVASGAQSPQMEKEIRAEYQQEGLLD